MLLICCSLIERLLTFTLECFPWLSCYVNLCFCLPHSLYRTQPLGCDLTATECLFKKDEINRLNINWPFSLVYPVQLCTNVDKLLSKFVCHVYASGAHSYTWTLFDPVRPLSVVSKQTQRDPGVPAATPVPLTELCLCVWPMKMWVTEKWCELLLLSGCSTGEHVHCLALCSGCQSVSVSICHSKGEQKELKCGIAAVALRFLST